jgi:hypothetical protein
VVSVTLTSWTGTLIETEQSDLVILSKITLSSLQNIIMDFINSSS